MTVEIINADVTRDDRVGRRYGNLVVLAPAKRSAAGKIRWLCLCDCGRETVAAGSNLVTGHTKSCGCQKPVLNSLAHTTHGHKKGRRESPEYRCWSGIITRCLNPRHHAYPRYGGRGITVCERWRNDFAAFLADMGPRPPGTSIDRIDVNGNYEPGNVRWATRSEQSKNRRPGYSRGAANPQAKLSEIDVRRIRGDTRRLREIAAEFGISIALAGQIRNRKAWVHVTD